MFGIALASASLPTMSAQAARGDTRGAHGDAELRAAAVRVHRGAGHGRAGGCCARRSCACSSSAASSAPPTPPPPPQALVWYAVGLAGFSATRIAAQTFYAIGDPRTPVLWASSPSPPTCCVALGAHVAARARRAWPWRRRWPPTSTSAALAVAARRRLGRIGGRAMLRLGRAHARRLGRGARVVSLGRPRIWPAGRRARVAATIAGGAVVFGAVAIALRSPEARICCGCCGAGAGPCLALTRVIDFDMRCIPGIARAGFAVL